ARIVRAAAWNRGLNRGLVLLKERIEHPLIGHADRGVALHAAPFACLAQEDAGVADLHRLSVNLEVSGPVGPSDIPVFVGANLPNSHMRVREVVPLPAGRTDDRLVVEDILTGIRPDADDPRLLRCRAFNEGDVAPFISGYGVTDQFLDLGRALHLGLPSMRWTAARQRYPG